MTTRGWEYAKRNPGSRGALAIADAYDAGYRDALRCSQCGHERHGCLDGESAGGCVCEYPEPGSPRSKVEP